MELDRRNAYGRLAEIAGLPWVWGFPWVWVWDGYGDCDESQWACGNFVGIFDWVEIKQKCVKYAINVIVGV